MALSINLKFLDNFECDVGNMFVKFYQGPTITYKDI